MKKRDLKNRLDEIPQSFDKEALWDRISDKKPERSRPIFWIWLVPAVMVAGLASLVWSIRLDHKTVAQSEGADLQDTATVIIESATDKTAVEVDQLAIASPSAASHLQLNIPTSKPEMLEHEQSTALEGTDATSSVTLTNRITNDNMPLVQPEHFSTELINSDLPSNQNTIKNTMPLYTNDISNDYSVYSAPSVPKSGVQPASAIISLGFHAPLLPMGVRKPIVSVEAAPLPLLTEHRSAPWVIALGVSYGTESHNFTKSLPIGSESELEAIGANLLFSRNMGRWRLGVGVSHVLGNTFLGHRTISSSYLPAFGQVVREFETTSYRLFNTYARTDLYLQTSYGLRLFDRVEVRPSISLGTNVLVVADGDYIGLDGELVDLSDDYQDRLGLYGQVGLSISYRLSSRMSITAGISLQTKRSYKADHSISPKSANLSFYYDM